MRLVTMNNLSFVTVLTTVLITGATLYASDNDDKIEAAFEKSYVYKTYLKDDSIKTDAKDGVVTLTGTVADETHKNLAQETVASVSGVTQVNNELVTKAEAATENADIWIGRKVKFALLFNRHVSYLNTTVAVENGYVSLTGKAESIAQKDLTTEYAKDIDGVKGVKNEMTVEANSDAAGQTTGEKIDDVSVTAQVKTSLLSHSSTSGIKTAITTYNGEVTITGIAKNEAEKALVTKRVADINGVTSVNNQMTVK